METRESFHVAAESASGPWSFIEKAAGLVAGLGGTASVLGFFALFVEFRRLNVPRALLTWEEAARAGALPTIALGLAVFLLYVLKRSFRPSMRVASIVLYSLMGVAILPGFLFGFPWILSFLVSVLTHKFSLPAIADLYISYALYIVIVVIIAVQKRRSNRQLKDTADASGEPGSGTRVQATSASSAVTKDASTTTSTSKEATARKKLLGVARYAGIYSWVCLFYVLPSLFGMRWFSLLLDLRWTLVERMSNVAVWWTSVEVSIVFGLIYSCVSLVQEFGAADIQNERYPMIAIAIAVVVFGVFITLYSEVWYEHAWSALGGGRSEILDLWIKAEDISPDVQAFLPANSCATLGKLVRCKGIESHISGDMVLLLPKGRPAIVLRRDSLKVVSVAQP